MHDDLSTGLRTHVTILSVVACISNPSTWEAETGRSLELAQQAILAKSFKPMRNLVSKEADCVTEDETQGCPLAYPCIHI